MTPTSAPSASEPQNSHAGGDLVLELGHVHVWLVPAIVGDDAPIRLGCGVDDGQDRGDVVVATGAGWLTSPERSKSAARGASGGPGQAASLGGGGRRVSLPARPRGVDTVTRSESTTSSDGDPVIGVARSTPWIVFTRPRNHVVNGSLAPIICRERRAAGRHPRASRSPCRPWVSGCRNVRSWTPARRRESLNSLWRGPFSSAMKSRQSAVLPGRIGNSTAINDMVVSDTVCRPRRRTLVRRIRDRCAHRLATAP